MKRGKAKHASELSEAEIREFRTAKDNVPGYTSLPIFVTKLLPGQLAPEEFGKLVHMFVEAKTKREVRKLHRQLFIAWYGTAYCSQPKMKRFIAEGGKEVSELNDDEAGRMRASLERKGRRIVAKLVRQNRQHLIGASAVNLRFNISSTKLLQGQLAGGIIGYRSSPKADWLYPVEQFGKRRIEKWAKAVVDTVGNGAAAIDFLYVPRADLENRSIADLLREDRKKGEQYLVDLLRSLTEE